MTKSTKKETPVTPTEGRVCAQCNTLCPPVGGMNFLSEDQTQHRWICKQCRGRLEQRLKKLL